MKKNVNGEKTYLDISTAHLMQETLNEKSNPPAMLGRIE